MLEQTAQGTGAIILAAAALIPAILLCIFVFVKDKAEKEPIGLLIILLLAGAFVCFPAAITETLLDQGITSAFSGSITTYSGEVYFSSQESYSIYRAIKYFLGVALVEEGFKWLVMFLITHKNKNFNSLFDGIIYAVFVSLGFAALENVFYVFDYGMQNALIRAFTAVPGHTFFAVFMGYYYSLWHTNKKAQEYEIRFRAQGLPIGETRFKPGRFLALSIIMPTLIHGFYDFSCTSNLDFMIFVFLGFLLALYIICFVRIHKMSKTDKTYDKAIPAVFLNAYPEIVEAIRQQSQQNYNNY